MRGIWDAMADKTRREILMLLKYRPHTAGEIADQFLLSAATVSHHLSVLKESGLITSEKRAQTIIYSMNTDVVQELVREVYEYVVPKRSKK